MLGSKYVFRLVWNWNWFESRHNGLNLLAEVFRACSLPVPLDTKLDITKSDAAQFNQLFSKIDVLSDHVTELRAVFSEFAKALVIW
jgi:hypothetical protein